MAFLQPGPAHASAVAFASLTGTTIEWYDFTCSYLMAETLRSGLRADEPVRAGAAAPLTQRG